jgi:hypothetical protein
VGKESLASGEETRGSSRYSIALEMVTTAGDYHRKRGKEEVEVVGLGVRLEI